MKDETKTASVSCENGSHDYRVERIWEVNGRCLELLRCALCGKTSVAWVNA